MDMNLTNAPPSGVIRLTSLHPLSGEEWVEWSATGLKDASVFDPWRHSKKDLSMGKVWKSDQKLPWLVVLFFI